MATDCRPNPTSLTHSGWSEGLAGKNPFSQYTLSSSVPRQSFVLGRESMVASLELRFIAS